MPQEINTFKFFKYFQIFFHKFINIGGSKLGFIHDILVYNWLFFFTFTNTYYKHISKSMNIYSPIILFEGLLFVHMNCEHVVIYSTSVHHVCI